MRHFFLRCMALLLVVLLFSAMLSACTVGFDSSGAEIVCTVFPVYDWVLQVLGAYAEQYSVRWLSDNGAELHSYQPSVADIAEISDCSVFFYVGGASDEWVETITLADGRASALLDAVDVCDETCIEDEHDGEHAEHEHDHEEIDEHFWMSLSNAKMAVSEICRVLSEVYAKDEEAVTAFHTNAKSYTDRLDALDERYREAVANAERDTILVADRFPFVYLVRDYGISYEAAFSGCSTDTDASFETIARLSDVLREQALSVILITETGNNALAETLIHTAESESVEVLVLHSCQAVTKSDFVNGIDYLSIMENNLAVLTRALAV